MCITFQVNCHTWLKFLYASGNVSVTFCEPCVKVEVQFASEVSRLMEMLTVFPFPGCSSLAMITYLSEDPHRETVSPG